MLDDLLTPEPKTPPETKKTAPPMNVEINIPVVEEEKETTKKPRTRKKSTPVKLEADPVLTANISMFIGAITMMTAKVTNNPIWQFSPEESNAISEPAARILERLGASEISNKYGDYIALSVALGTAIIPRVVITQQNKTSKIAQPDRKEIPRYEQPADEQPKRTVQKRNRGNNQELSIDPASLIDDRIPALAD